MRSREEKCLKIKEQEFKHLKERKSPMGVLESMTGRFPSGCRDLHFIVTHSLGFKTAVEQWRCPARHRAVQTQALDWGCAEDLTHRHQHLCSHSSCGASSSSCDHSRIAGCKNQCVVPLHTPELTCMAQMHTAVCVHRWVGRSPQKIKAVLTTSHSC